MIRTAATMGVPYCGTAPVPAELWARWNLDPLLIAALAAAALLWLWRIRAGSRSNLLFAGGYAVLLIAFLSPLCALSSALFSARAVHHLLLVAVAAPLLALALPGAGRRLSLGFWTAAHALIFWLWHAPALYGWALSNDFIYWLMQASLLGSAIAFWAAALGGPARTPSVALAFVAMIAQMGMLGALITFAPQPLYAAHVGVTEPFGLTSIEDQQLAGLTMWVLSLPIYMAAALAILARRFRDAPETGGGREERGAAL